MPNGLMNFETTNTSSIPGPRAIIITQIPCKALYVPWGKTNRCARSSQMNYMNRTDIVDMPAISLLLHTKKPGLKKKTLTCRTLFAPNRASKEDLQFACESATAKPEWAGPDGCVLLFSFFDFVVCLARRRATHGGSDNNLSRRRLVPFKRPS